jgi:branched-chain amino acid transport system substrate-binding protein
VSDPTVSLARRRMLAGLLLAPLAAGCARAATTTAGTAAIRVGGLFALTGDDAALDRPAADGARLAATEINAAGGLLGRPLELVVRDTRTAAYSTVRAARAVVAEDRVVAVVGFTNTDPLLAAAPTIRAAGLPFITPGATSPRIPAQAGPRVFLACFGDNAQAAAGAEFAAARFGRRACVLRNVGVEYTRLLADYFTRRFVELGGTVAVDDRYPDKTTDVSAHLARVKALPARPDFFYLAAMAYDVGAIVKQYRAAGLAGPIVGGDAYDAPEFLQAAGRDGDNVFFTTHALMEGDDVTAPVRAFAAAYRAAYRRAPESAFAALGYDAVRLLADAIRRAGSLEADAIQAALAATRDFTGVTGSISFPAGHRVPSKSVTVIAVRDGRLTLGATFVPAKVPSP